MESKLIEIDVLYVCLCFYCHVHHTKSLFICTDIYKFTSNQRERGGPHLLRVYMSTSTSCLDSLRKQNWSKHTVQKKESYVSQKRVHECTKTMNHYFWTQLHQYAKTTKIRLHWLTIHRILKEWWFHIGARLRTTDQTVAPNNCQGNNIRLSCGVCTTRLERRYSKPNCIEWDRQSDWLSVKWFRDVHPRR